MVDKTKGKPDDYNDKTDKADKTDEQTDLENGFDVKKQQDDTLMNATDAEKRKSSVPPVSNPNQTPEEKKKADTTPAGTPKDKKVHRSSY
jgi:Skp family chaperone for outer membrane proteins